MAVYHAQQAAEKALKGFLVRHGRAVPRVHDLVALLATGQAIDASLGALLGAAKALTPYATRFRYPDPSVPVEPRPAEAQRALQLAETIVREVRQRV